MGKSSMDKCGWSQLAMHQINSDKVQLTSTRNRGFTKCSKNENGLILRSYEFLCPPSLTNTVDTYVCLLLHVLIGDNSQIVVNDDDANSISDWVEQAPDPSMFSKLKSFFKGGNKTDGVVRDAETAAEVHIPQNLNTTPIAHHYHPDRRLIFNSTRKADLTVAVEQVSIFLTNDGTLITFFQVALLRFKI